ncbi:hypothetical protein APA_982 [Pseudanabaena sp. lw0831]|uniref:hypothetical protein n=1 Tax=Pseudanabaena sp. lw0831 TaxID=1357935 RepID=UPI001916BEC9|nr:hypothetical protein [Pseudanabaena sp. lw0831]GBO53074.1 hypothetical protein APA_982 [Pseudanabaena sp. lw0831]
MNESIKATRATIEIGTLSVDAFMLPDGSYRMSLSQAAECIGKPARGTFDFLQSKAFKRLLGEVQGTFGFLPSDFPDDYKSENFTVEIGDGSSQGQTRIRGLPLELVALYWAWESFRGNRLALMMTVILTSESLERRFDNAFGITRTEQERNARLSQINQQLEKALAILGEGFALDDDVRRERDYFESVLKQNGIDPYSLPSDR